MTGVSGGWIPGDIIISGDAAKDSVSTFSRGLATISGNSLDSSFEEVNKAGDAAGAPIAAGWTSFPGFGKDGGAAPDKELPWAFALVDNWYVAPGRSGKKNRVGRCQQRW